MITVNVTASRPELLAKMCAKMYAYIEERLGKDWKYKKERIYIILSNHDVTLKVGYTTLHGSQVYESIIAFADPELFTKLDLAIANVLDISKGCIPSSGR